MSLDAPSLLTIMTELSSIILIMPWFHFIPMRPKYTDNSYLNQFESVLVARGGGGVGRGRSMMGVSESTSLSPLSQLMVIS